jgi:prepilin peptidase CpaA
VTTWSVAFAVLLTASAGYDFWTLRIPNVIPLAIAAMFVLAQLTATMQGSLVAHLGACALVFAFGLPAFAFGVLGGGDVKLLMAAALWLGLAKLPVLLILTGIAGGVFALLLLGLRPYLPFVLASLPAPWVERVPPSFHEKAPVPYGVAIAAAGLVAQSLPA